MRFSAIRTGIVATAAAVALAACGGHGLVPAQNVGGAAPDLSAPSAMSPDVTTPCNSMSPKFWNFGGSCVEDDLTAAGKVLKLKAYMGLSAVIGIGKNNAKGKVPFIVGDATGNKDITGKAGTHRWVPYGKACVSSTGKPTPCLGKAFMYVEAINGGKTTVVLAATPSINITNTKGFKGKSFCFPSPLTTKGWSLEAEALGKKPVGKKLVIPSEPKAFPLPAGAIVLALACQ